MTSIWRDASIGGKGIPEWEGESLAGRGIPAQMSLPENVYLLSGYGPPSCLGGKFM
jgi:hypothetical protein